eukprot:6193958-Pleurochrysis_carterae.AAC.1
MRRAASDNLTEARGGAEQLQPGMITILLASIPIRRYLMMNKSSQRVATTLQRRPAALRDSTHKG